MKSHPHLLLRDALAALFIRATAGEDGARDQIRALERWAKSGSVEAELQELWAEDGDPLFDMYGLTSRFQALAGYTQDRIRRFTAALQWIGHGKAKIDPIAISRCAWDAGLFFEVHEILEPAWMASRGAQKDELQGLIMAAAAFHHLCDGNLAGTKGLLRDACRKLNHSSAYAGFTNQLGCIAGAVERGEITGPNDIKDFPRLGD